jgi:creatinine amidohydrolase/Fe(II)-dependent formamide hydrolase-like protein
MAQKNNEISLKGKMDDWGPFGKNEGKWLIFSIGNPEEGHGYALPRIMDDLFAQRAAHLITCKSGARYVAHIPWATDSFVSVARDWAPRIIPVEELVENIKKFLKYHMEIFRSMDLPASKILILSGHGGNNPLNSYAEEIKNYLKLENLIIAPSDKFADDNMDEFLREVEKLSLKLATEHKSARKIKRDLIKILTSAGHASHFEHSAAAALGILDEEKLKVMNEELERDFEGALQKWPPIGGLGGFLMAGGKYVEAIGTKENDKNGLWNCLKTLRKLDRGKIKAIKELGELVINILVEYYSEMLLNE